MTRSRSLAAVAAGDEVIFESRPKLVLVALYAALILAGGWFLVVPDDTDVRGHELAVPLGVLAMVFGTVTLIGLGRRAARSRPLLDRGLIDGTAMGGDAFIHWLEVTELTLVTLGSTKIIAGHVKDPRQLQLQKRVVARSLSRLNRRFADFWIPTSTMAEPAESVMDRMLALWRPDSG